MQCFEVVHDLVEHCQLTIGSSNDSHFISSGIDVILLALLCLLVTYRINFLYTASIFFCPLAVNRLQTVLQYSTHDEDNYCDVGVDLYVFL